MPTNIVGDTLVFKKFRLPKFLGRAEGIIILVGKFVGKKLWFAKFGFPQESRKSLRDEPIDFIGAQVSDGR